MEIEEDGEAPPSMTLEEFKQKHTTITATVALNLGQVVAAYVVENKVYLMSAVKFKVPSARSPDAKPVLLYAGGSWIGESSKACSEDRGLFLDPRRLKTFCRSHRTRTRQWNFGWTLWTTWRLGFGTL